MRIHYPKSHNMAHALFLNVLIAFKGTKNIKTSSFKSSENIKKKEGGSDKYVSDNQTSSVTLNELAWNFHGIYCCY